MIVNPMECTVLGQRAIYMSDLAAVHLHWLCQALWSEDYDLAVASNNRLQNLSTAINEEMQKLKAAGEASRLSGEAAGEWRRNRDRATPSSSTRPREQVADPATCLNGEAA